MPKEVTCPPCGEVITGADDDELVANVQEHARSEHELELSREQILAEARES